MTEFNKVFIDTAPLIYYLEEHPLYHNIVKKFLEECLEQDKMIVSSAITVEEYCVFPYRMGNYSLIEMFYDFCEDAGIEIVDIDRTIAQKAARIRAKYKDFKAMDALQLAAACESDCDLFLTNDRQLQQFEEIKCEIIDSWIY
ncbi:MAG: type II toxin-antitoxin system VapC family toxin [Lachnospiraceae bacterium]|nr:type II toxin-antitoxin system VapC family toxin [Lachnospiraceae bacterium]